MDRGAWQAIVHGVEKSRTRLKQLIPLIFGHLSQYFLYIPYLLKELEFANRENSVDLSSGSGPYIKILMGE